MSKEHPKYQIRRQLIHNLPIGKELVNNNGTRFKKLTSIEWKVINFGYSNSTTISTPDLLIFAHDLELAPKNWYEDAPIPWVFNEKTKTLNVIAKSGFVFKIYENLQRSLQCKTSSYSDIISESNSYEEGQEMIKRITDLIHKDHGGWPDYVKQ